MEVRESDEGGGEFWGATGGIWVLETLELTTEHRNGSYPLRGGGVPRCPPQPPLAPEDLVAAVAASLPLTAV